MIKAIAKTITIVSLAFIVIVSVILILNYIRLQSVSPESNKVVEHLIIKLSENSEDEQLKTQIRSLDLITRKAFFSTHTQLKAGALLLLSGVIIFLLSFKIFHSFSLKNNDHSKEIKTDYWLTKSKERFWIFFISGLFVCSAFLLMFLSGSAYTDFKTLAEISNHTQKNQEIKKDSSIKIATTDTIQPLIEDTIKETAALPLPDENAISSNWPNFRGPNGLGISYHKNIPTDWDGKSGKNILWKIALPLHGYNSPVIWGDYLFVTGANANKREVYCINRHSGKLLWAKAADNIPGSPAAAPKVTEDTGLAASSVATDGKQVYAIFGNGDIICFDFKGTRIWAKNLGVPNNHYGHSSSLILYSQRLIVQYDHNKARNIIGLDTKDGEVRWNTTRPGKISWSSPSMIKKGSSYQVVVNNEPFVAAYNPENGKELWKIECLSGEIGPSPAYANGIIFAVNEYAKLAAIQLENSPKILWENNDFLSEVASPVAMGEYLIVPTSSGEVACYNTKDGTIFWQHEFDIGFYSSPIIADGKIYLINRDGVMHIMKLDKIFNLISEPKLGEKTDCTPAFAKERIYIRGQNNLYCIK
ncbi:MAG: hypothetical protein A2275_02750 [Bacteroidetes bacterium RIFOXYA12_FULL_35_11]|nr:MAG: hypothetical protein A2X01_21210 [Bacteroidetes bacterium GWF2_35_48]OFY80930.1 MAG: hypothetical protein A2275_02750 [Bacteroidetes bacterium RIFOXYA12_FULL_35_11]